MTEPNHAELLAAAKLVKLNDREFDGGTTQRAADVLADAVPILCERIERLERALDECEKLGTSRVTVIARDALRKDGGD